MEVRRLRDDELQHHGVKGQRWGIRRYQNEDGSLTAAGQKRYLKQVKNVVDQPYYVGGNKEKYFANKTANKTDYGQNVFNSDNVSKSYNTLKKKNELNAYITNIKSEDAYKENKIFSEKLKKAGIKYSIDDLDYSINQIVCINRGVDPKKYANELSKAQDDYENAIEKESKKYFGEPLSKYAKNNMSDTIRKVVNNAVLNEIPIYDSDMYDMFSYDEDDEIVSKLLKTKE